MSLFRRPRSPFWYCELQVAGRRIVRSTQTDDKREARRYEQRLRAQLEAEAGRPKRRELTLSQACGAYWLEHGQKLSWADDVKKHLEVIVGFFGEEKLVSEIGPDEIDELVVERERPKQAKGSKRIAAAGAAGVNRTLAVLRSVLRRRKCRPFAQQIVWKEHFKKESKGRVRYLQPDDVGVLLEALRRRGPHIADGFEWSIYSGCRKGETYDLTKGDVQPDHVTVDGKTGARVVWLSSELMAILDRQAAMKDPAADKDTPIFDKTNHRKIWAASLQEVGIEDFTWHDCRHTFATWLRKSGAPIEVVQRALGHASLAMTMKYAHVDDAEVRNALRQLPTLAPNTKADANVIPLKRKGKRGGGEPA